MNRKSQTSLMDYMNKDILGVIMATDAGTITSLMRTCKELLKLVKSHYSKNHRALTDKIVLRFTQCVLRDTFRSMKEGTMLFQARKSFGKTISGFACAGKCGMVLLTPNLMKVWISEAKNIDWYNANPDLSKVICLATTVKRHSDYVKTVLASSAPLVRTGTTIILVGDSRVRDGISFLEKIQTEEPKVLIIDEAHTKRKSIPIAQYYCKWNREGTLFDKQLLLSADVMCPEEIGIYSPYRKVRVKQLDKVPSITWDVISDPDEEWETILERALDIYDRVVLVANKDKLVSIETSERVQAKRGTRHKTYLGAKIFYQKRVWIP